MDLSNQSSEGPGRTADRLMISVSNAAAMSVRAATAPAEPASEPNLFTQAWTARSVVVADTNALASSCVRAAKTGKPPAIFTVVGSGQACVVVGAHVPGEMPRAIVDITGRDHDLSGRALAVWNDYLSNLVVVIDLPIGEHLRPEIQVVQRGLALLGRAVKPDPDDLPTAALAAFLAPAVIWTDDRIFTETGMAAANSRSTASALQTVVVVESVGTQAFVGATLLGRASYAGLAPVVRGARQRLALAGFAVVAVVAVVAYLLLDDDKRTDAVRKLKAVGAGFAMVGGHAMDVAADLARERSDALQSMARYENPPWRQSTGIELCARTLLTSGHAWTATQLLVDLADKAPDLVTLSATQLNAQLSLHPAFRRTGDRRWTVGRAASVTHPGIDSDE